MSSKSKWDQPAPVEDAGAKASKNSAKGANDAAAAAAAIAAKIAAQFAAGAFKDEGAFQKDIDINDVRNRYMLTRGSTQQEVRFFNPLPWFVFTPISTVVVVLDPRGNGCVGQHERGVVS